MPTGYTADVVDGKVTEFKDFALQCARAFGALITMRDDPHDAPIPDEIEPETQYADRAIEDGLKRLGEIQAMSNADADKAARKAHEKAMKARRKYISDQEIEAERLNAMLEKVRAWSPPTPDHDGMKEFMIEQLTISMPGNYGWKMPVLLDGQTWRKQELDRLAKDVAYHKEERAKAIERAAGRSAWLKSLRSSLAA